MTKRYLSEAFLEFAENMKVWFENILDEKLEEKLDQKLETKFEEKLGPIRNELRGIRMDLDLTRMDVHDLRSEMKDEFINTNKRIDIVYNHVDHFIGMQKEITKRLVRLEQKQPA